MRLSQFEIDAIQMLTAKYFGDGAHAFLFGSRANDDLKGGDIDLFVKSDHLERLTFRAKVGFLAELKMKIGDQKIDLVLDNNTKRRRSFFYQSIINSAVQVC